MKHNSIHSLSGFVLHHYPTCPPFRPVVSALYIPHGDFGIGIRVFKGMESVYAYTTDFSKDGLLKTARNAAQAIKGNTIIQPAPLVHEYYPTLHPIRFMPQEKWKQGFTDLVPIKAMNYSKH